MGKLAEVAGKLRKYAAPNYNPLPFDALWAKGEWIHAVLKDRAGNEKPWELLLDLHGNYSAIGLGHNHPEIVELKTKRLQENRPALITPSEGMQNEFAELAEKITRISGMEMVLPKNVGTEAFDSAVKAARLWGYQIKGIARKKAEIIVAKNNFHGRSLAATAASTTKVRRKWFWPFGPSRAFVKVPFGDVKVIAEEITQHTAAIILEPIQAEAGVIVPAEGYLSEVRRICTENNILFILDEVQTGIGRTGKMFAWQYEGESARPDGMMLGKNLGGGANIISMLLLKREVLELFQLGMEGSTFGGNAEACAVASKTIDILSEPGFMERVERLGESFIEGLRAINSPLIKEIRGRGLLVAMELVPEAGGARRVQEALLHEGGIISIARHENTIGFSPPLVINEHNLLVFGVQRIAKALKTLESQKGRQYDSCL